MTNLTQWKTHAPKVSPELLGTLRALCTECERDEKILRWLDRIETFQRDVDVNSLPENAPEEFCSEWYPLRQDGEPRKTIVDVRFLALSSRVGEPIYQAEVWYHRLGESNVATIPAFINYITTHTRSDYDC